MVSSTWPAQTPCPMPPTPLPSSSAFHASLWAPPHGALHGTEMGLWGCGEQR